MDSGANKMPVKVIKEMQLEERRFRSKLVKMIKEADSKFNDYSHWSYELTEKDFFIDLTNKCIKMSYYWFTENKSCKKQKRDILKKKLLSII